MKHIYIIDEHQSSKQNGVGTYIRQLLKCFEDSGHEVNLLSFESDEKDFKIEKVQYYREYHIPICGTNNFLRIGALTFSILRLYISDRKDNVFFVNHSPCSLFLKNLKKIFPLSEIIFVIHDQGWCAPLLGNDKKLKTILTTCRAPEKEKDIWRIVRRYCNDERKMYSIADRIVALAKPTSDLLETIYKVSNNKIHLIPNGKSMSASPSDDMRQILRAKFGFEKDEIIILYAGRIVKSKGVYALLSAFEELFRNNHSLQLVIAGQVMKLKEYAIRTPFSSSHITYTGLISEDDVAKWCSIADICILPSYTEQSSYFGIEMLANGNLIIATDGNNLTEMFDDKVALIAKTYYEEKDFKKELISQLMKAIEMDEYHKIELQESARQRYLEMFSFAIMKQAYLQLLS